MKTFRSKLKFLILSIIEFSPFGYDLYLCLARNSFGISYRGVFNDFDSALKVATLKKSNRYDVVNKNKAANYENEKEGLEHQFHDFDYPLIFWLSRLIEENMMVVELGGSLGHFFYSIQKLFPCPDNIKWTIAELPEAVKLGDKLAKERNEKRLSFIESHEISNHSPANIFLTAGTLQYMEQSLQEILTSMDTFPEHVLVHNLPTHQRHACWTLQNLELCEVPYRIYSKITFITAMRELGYDLVDDWAQVRSVEIPFHLDFKIDGYLGYYFKRKS